LLAPAVLGDRADEALVLQHGQGGVDHSGARPVGAARAVLQLAHQLVAVARLLGAPGEHHEAQVAMLKEPAHAAPAAHGVAHVPPEAVAAPAFVSVMEMSMHMSILFRYV